MIRRGSPERLRTRLVSPTRKRGSASSGLACASGSQKDATAICRTPQQAAAKRRRLSAGGVAIVRRGGDRGFGSSADPLCRGRSARPNLPAGSGRAPFRASRRSSAVDAAPVRPPYRSSRSRRPEVLNAKQVIGRRGELHLLPGVSGFIRRRASIFSRRSLRAVCGSAGSALRLLKPAIRSSWALTEASGCGNGCRRLSPGVSGLSPIALSAYYRWTRGRSSIG